MHVAKDKIRHLASHCSGRCSRLREIARIYRELDDPGQAREILGDADEWRQLEQFLLGMIGEGDAHT